MQIDELIYNHVANEIRRFVASAQPITIQSLDGGKTPIKSSVQCPRCGNGVMILRHGKNGVLWVCSNYPDCKMTASDKDGKPVFKSEALHA